MAIKQFSTINYKDDKYFVTKVGKRVLYGRKIISSTGQVSPSIKSIPIKDIESREPKKYTIFDTSTKKNARYPGIKYKGYLILKKSTVTQQYATYIVAKDFGDSFGEFVTQRAAKIFINKRIK